MPQGKYLLIVGGPTASGKTEWSIQLAQRFNCPILSADSRQFYREMYIGTAKPSPEELAAAPHYFIDHRSIEDTYTVGDYEREAIALLDQCFEKHDVVILAGGSGLFVQAVCEGFDEFPAIPDGIRSALQNDFQQSGLAFLQEELKKCDPTYYAQVDLQNPQRLMRALEVYRATGKAYSHFRRRQNKARNFQAIYLFTHWLRPLLYQRIEQRVDQMMKQGLLAEVQQLLPYQAYNALQTVGYQELFAHLRGETSLAEAVALLKRNTRRFAKRQLTWNRRLGYGKHFSKRDREWLDRYLDWVWQSGQQLYWKRDRSGISHSLGTKGPKAQREILQLEERKQQCRIRLVSPEAPLPESDLPYFLLHEIQCRLPDHQLMAELPDTWTKALQKAHFKRQEQQWIFTKLFKK